MLNLESMIQSQIEKDKQEQSLRLSKEEFAQMKKEQRARLYDMADNQFMIAVSSPDNYLNYLNMQSQFSQYTPTNVMLVLAQKPQATELRDFESWKKMKCSIRLNEKGIDIFVPGNTYTRQDGMEAVSYEPRKVFDVSQLKQAPYKRFQKPMSVSDLVSALVYKIPYKVEFIERNESLPSVHYHYETQSLTIQKGITESAMLNGLATELCYAEFAQKYEYNRDDAKLPALSAAYMLCKKYNITTPDPSFTQDAPNFFEGSKPADVREALNNVKGLFKGVSERMEHGIFSQQQTQEQAHSEHFHESR